MNSPSFTRRTLLAGSAATALLDGLPPANSDPAEWTLLEASTALRRRRISSVELTKCVLDRIQTTDRKLNSFITLTADAALAQAGLSDEKRDAAAGPLYGIPVAIKDNIDTAGLRTTAASRVFERRVPREDAEVVRRLKGAGIILLGKLNLDEMAFEGTGTTGCFGPVHNPWSVTHITGGSSAGSAAAVSAGFCYASVGSDDGGSVRIPAAFCGVVGFKTTYGRVSTRGVIPSAYSLDTIGPIARSVGDAAAMLNVVAGFDPQDAITSSEPVPDYLAALGMATGHLRVGVPRDYYFEDLHPDVARHVELAIEIVRPLVKSVREVKLPRFQFVENGSYDVELYHYQKPFFETHPELYHPWSREELEDLKTVQAVPYVETLKRIRDCRRDIRVVFEEVDILLLPTMREPAPLMSETINRTHHRPPSNVSAFNRFGTPAITVPCGLSSDGMPIGLQIVGPAFAEERVLSVAYAFEQAVPFYRQHKPQLREN